MMHRDALADASKEPCGGVPTSHGGSLGEKDRLISTGPGEEGDHHCESNLKRWELQQLSSAHDMRLP